MIKPLLCYFHAVEIQEIFDNLKEIPCDQYHISYFKYPYPHRIVENLFRKNKQYTHLIIVANDMVPTKKCYDQLVDDLAKFDYPIISGMVNVDAYEHKTDYNICFKLPSLEFNERKYGWLADSTRKMYLEKSYTVLPVKFSGFPMMFVKREVLEKTRLNHLDKRIQTTDKPIWEMNTMGYANDLCFAHNCHVNNITMYADLRCVMKHFGLKGKQKVGTNQPRIKFIPYNANSEHGKHAPNIQVH